MAFDFYFAGMLKLETMDYVCKLGVNILSSYGYDMKNIMRLLERKRSGQWSGNLFIDSGAFTVHRKNGTVDVDAYISFLNENKDCISRAVQLDDIPGVWGEVKTAKQMAESPIKSWDNYLYMVSKLERPEMLLPVFHQGENFKYLSNMVEYKYANGKPIEYICVSGNKELTKKQRKQWYAKVYDVIKRSSNPHVKVHCLGSATLTDMQEFPFTSSDATSWLMTSANGSILTPFGTVLVSSMQKFSKDHILNRPPECLQTVHNMCNEFGIKFDDLMESHTARSHFNVRYLYKASQETTFVERNLKISRGLF